MDKIQAEMIRDAMIKKMAYENRMFYRPSYDEWLAISWLADSHDTRCQGPDIDQWLDRSVGESHS